MRAKGDQAVPHKVFQITKKVDLASIVEDNLNLQDIIRFSEGAEDTKEDLHYEDSPDSTVRSYEILIPFDTAITILISPVGADSGTPELDRFESVKVQIGEGIIIHPKTCHLVKQAGRFLVLKTTGGWKFTRGAATEEGECRYQKGCKARDVCLVA